MEVKYIQPETKEDAEYIKSVEADLAEYTPEKHKIDYGECVNWALTCDLERKMDGIQDLIKAGGTVKIRERFIDGKLTMVFTFTFEEQELEYEINNPITIAEIGNDYRAFVQKVCADRIMSVFKTLDTAGRQV